MERIEIVVMIIATQCIWIDSQVTKQNGITEYCQWETFNATCRPNEVIIMEHAFYGRMRIGRCVPYEYILGCATDVLDQLASRCSGRDSCLVNVPDAELFKVHPCRKDLVAYLEASYRCVPVTGIPEKSTQSASASSAASATTGPCSTPITISQSSGYLAGSVAHRTGFGSTRCPWVLRVPPGQRINVTLFDFSTRDMVDQPPRSIDRTSAAAAIASAASSSSSSGPETGCSAVAIFKEGANEKRQTRVCSKSTDKRRSIYTSRTNHLSIIIPNEGHNEHHNTIIYFEPIGCPDPEVSSNAILTRREETLAIFCNVTGEKWHLVCKDNSWIGSFSNCSKSIVAPAAEDVAVKLNKGFPLGLLVAIAIGVIAGVFLGFLLLVMIFSCRKRFFHRRPEQSVLLIDYENPQKVYKQLDLMKSQLPPPLQHGCECVLAEFRSASDSIDPSDPMIIHTPIHPPPEVYFSEEILRKTLNKCPAVSGSGRHHSSSADCTCSDAYRNTGTLCCDTWSPGGGGGGYFPEEYGSIGTCSPLKINTTARLL